MKILMVCLGNICRSPLAEGILRKKLSEKKLKVEVDSAGTGGWHVGERPDARAIKAGNGSGVDISSLSGRQFSSADFDHFDKIFVMDKENLREVLSQARSEKDKAKVDLILNAGKPGTNRSVPDPYYGGEEGFLNVVAMLNEACDAIVEELEKKS